MPRRPEDTKPVGKPSPARPLISNETLLQTISARDNDIENLTAELAKAEERAALAEQKHAELQKHLAELTTPPPLPGNL